MQHLVTAFGTCTGEQNSFLVFLPLLRLPADVRASHCSKTSVCVKLIESPQACLEFSRQVSQGVVLQEFLQLVESPQVCMKIPRQASQAVVPQACNPFLFHFLPRPCLQLLLQPVPLLHPLLHFFWRLRLRRLLQLVPLLYLFHHLLPEQPPD